MIRSNSLQRRPWKFKFIYACFLMSWISFFQSQAQDQPNQSQQVSVTSQQEALMAQAEISFSQGNPLESAQQFHSIFVSAPSTLKWIAGARLTEVFLKLGYPQIASYFFLKTLQSGHRQAIRHVLRFIPVLVESLGSDLISTYVLKFSTSRDFDGKTRAYFQYIKAKNEILRGSAKQAYESLMGIDGISQDLAPQVLYLRGTALAFLNQPKGALDEFRRCEEASKKQRNRDLQYRCLASQARTKYETGDFEKADDLYDDIPKSSVVWTDILFEQAWTSFALRDFNKSLGKMVTYRSPLLSYMKIPEGDLLRAQSYAALCIYDDVNLTIDDFRSRYTSLGQNIRDVLTKTDTRLFYDYGKSALLHRFQDHSIIEDVLQRFVLSSHFSDYQRQESEIEIERVKILNRLPMGSFRDYIEELLSWRLQILRLLGGMYLRNQLQDWYLDLVDQYESVSLVKAEVLSQQRAQILHRPTIMTEDEDGKLKRGASKVLQKSHQYFWTFNGEFWSDELGDYIFSLPSECP